MKSFLLLLKSKDYQDGVLIAVKTFSAAVLLLYLMFAVQKAYMVSGWKEPYESQRAQAKELALSYDAVKISGVKLANKPVLWSVAVDAGGNFFYQADKDRPIIFSNRPDLVADHKGLGVHNVLAVIRGSGPQAVFLDFLETY